VSVEKYNIECHSSIVKSWWSSRGVDFDLDILPSRGVVADEVAAGWIYFDEDGKVGWLAWIIADKDAPDLQRGRAVAAVISNLELTASRLGVKMVMASTENESLGRMYSKLGFSEADRGKTDYFKKVI